MSKKDGVVNLWDLPEDKVFIKLPVKLQKLMIEKALKIARDRNNLAKSLEVNPKSIYDFNLGRFGSIKLSFVRKSSEFLVKNGAREFSLDKLETQVKLIRTKTSRNPIITPKFPMNFSCKEGAQVIAGILFDGGITKGLRPFYTNNEENLVDRFIKNLEAVVGGLIYCKRQQSRTRTYQAEFSTVLGYILVNGLSLPVGKKIFSDPSVPGFIMKGSKDVQIAFLQQAFDDEGTINRGKNNSGRAISLGQNNKPKVPPRRLLQLKELLEKFDIDVNGPYFSRKLQARNESISYRWDIQLSNQANLEEFANKINFSLDKKVKRLKELLSYPVQRHFRKGTKYDEILKICLQLKARNVKLTNKNIAQELNKRLEYISKLTSIMVNKNMLRIVEEQKWTGFGSEEKEFDFI